MTTTQRKVVRRTPTVNVNIAMPGVSIGLSWSPSSAIRSASNFSSALIVVVTSGVVVFIFSVVDFVVVATDVVFTSVLFGRLCWGF